MKTPAQLTTATLALLGHDIIGLQCELKLVQMAQDHILATLMEHEEREFSLQCRIKALKDKVAWELRDNGLGPGTSAHPGADTPFSTSGEDPS